MFGMYANFWTQLKLFSFLNVYAFVSLNNQYLTITFLHNPNGMPSQWIKNESMMNHELLAAYFIQVILWIAHKSIHQIKYYICRDILFWRRKNKVEHTALAEFPFYGEHYELIFLLHLHGFYWSQIVLLTPQLHYC